MKSVTSLKYLSPLFYLTLLLSALVLISGCSGIFDVKGIDPRLAIGAVTDLGKSLTMSDEDVKNMAKGFANEYDSKHRVAPPNSSYAKRLVAIAGKHKKEDGLDLNYKVYLDKTVNAFAMADGTIRFYSGLMDLMNDDELLFILGHEIGHVKHGHIAKATKLSAASSGIRKGVASTSSVAGDVAASVAGGLLEKLVNMQFSQSQEYEADEYGVNFMKRHGYNVDGAITSFNKLAKLERKGGVFSNIISSHPTSQKRADALAKLIGDDSSIRIADLSDSNEEKSDTGVEPSESSVQMASSNMEEMDMEEVDTPSSMKNMTSNMASGNSAPEKSIPMDTSFQNKPSTSMSTTRGGGWYVQVLASVNRAGAMEIGKKLSDLGFASSEQSAIVHQREYHRILVGPYASRIEAEEGIGNIRNTGLTREVPFVRFISEPIASYQNSTKEIQAKEERLSQLR